MTIAVLDLMAKGLTAPYRRGLEQLDVPFGATNAAGETAIAAYDYLAYGTMYGGLQPQSPRYLLVPKVAAADPRHVTVWFKRQPNLPEDPPVDIAIPGGWPAGRGIAIPLPGLAASIGPQLRLTRFQPLPPASTAAADWEIIGLLGNLAKLLWAIGGEREELRTQLADVASQRNARDAHGASLDLLGTDLGVPRFPPRPHTWDPDALFLFHLDDRPIPPQAEVAVVADDRAAYDVTSHPGQNNGGLSRRAGRFGLAFEFAGPQTNITVPDDPEFALSAAASFSIEAVVKPLRTASGPGVVVAKRAVLNTAVDVGWGLTIGTARGIARNVRFSISDGAREVELFADRDIGDGAFHHLAGVVDRRPGPPAVTLGLLYVDGVEVARQVLDPLGALTSAAPILVGFGRESVANVLTDAPFLGLIDEVRLSKVARTAFDPVTGEGDGAYRRRLNIFQRWLLPTPENLARAINELAGPVANDSGAFIVDETVDPLVIGTLPVSVVPQELAPGRGIARDGNERTSEAAAVGTLDDEPDFDPAWLRRHEDIPGLDFAGIEANRLMQWSVRTALDALVARLTGAVGVLHVVGAYDPAAQDLRAVGRAVLLSHDAILPEKLAAQAHAAGFGWVEHTGTGRVRAAQPRADIYRIVPLDTGQVPRPPDVIEGQDLSIDVDPSIATFSDAHATWSLTRCGFGEATLTIGPAVKLHAIAAGDISVHAEIGRRRHTRGGSRVVRIGLTNTSLAAGDSIGGDGRRGVSEALAAGEPTADFDDTYLVVRTDDYTGQHPNVAYGPAVADRLMQRAMGAALDRVLDLLAANAGTLQVVKAYDPAASGLLTQGRALWLRHSNLPARALAARAFAAGFDYIRVDPGPPQTVQVGVREAEQIGVGGPHEVTVGAAVPLAIEPRADPAAIAFMANGAHAYVSDRGNHRVTSLSVAALPANAVPRAAFERSAAVPATPGALAVGGGHLFVAHELPGVISVLDPLTLAVTGTIGTGPRPIAMAADGSQLFVGCSGDTSLRVYDVNTNAQLGTLVLPAAPVAIAPVPGGASVYVVIAGDRFCQVDRATVQLVGAPIPTGSGATGAVVSPDGTRLFVACAADDPANASGRVRIYTTNNNQPSGLIGGFPPGAAPAILAISADQHYVYVGGGPAATAARIHVIDATIPALLPQLFTPGSRAVALATSPAGVAYGPCVLAASAEPATVTLGDPAPLALPQARPPRIVTSVGLGSGAGERVAWSTVPFSRGRVELASLVKPLNRMTGVGSGPTLVRAIYLHGSHLVPYQFEVRLKANLDNQPAVRIRKDQYDLVMNLLNWYHPLGVEVRTDRLRAHVVELRALDAELFPGYTYPTFHRQGLPPPMTAFAEEG